MYLISNNFSISIEYYRFQVISLREGSQAAYSIIQFTYKKLWGKDQRKERVRKIKCCSYQSNNYLSELANISIYFLELKTPKIG